MTTDEVPGGQAERRIRELPIELYDQHRYLRAFRGALGSLPERGVEEAGHVSWLRERAFGHEAVVILEGSEFPGALPDELRRAVARLDAAGSPRPPVLVVVPGFRPGLVPTLAARYARSIEGGLHSLGVTGVRVVLEADAIADVLGIDPAPFLEAAQAHYDDEAARERERIQRRDKAAIESLVAGGWPQRVRRVLVADDQELNRRVITAILARKAGVAPEVIDSSDGTDVLGRRFAEPAPDLLILDSGLPGQDAVSLVRAIRAREAAAGLPPVPIASLTADVTDAFRIELVEAGIDLFLSKPISTFDVLAAARVLLTRTASPLRRILVVDDREFNTRIARHIILSRLPGLDVETQSDPRAGLARCLADPRPDLLIVNGAMPYLTGPDLIQELRATESRDALARMPVIIDSAGGGYLEAGLGAGADVALALPWVALDLVLSLRALFPDATLVSPELRA